MTFRTAIGRLVPPLFADGVKRLLSSDTTYSGPYPTWAAASAAASGYSSEEVLARVASSSRLVLEGKAEYEQDGVAFTTPAPVNPLVCGLILAAALDSGRLSVLDFGGSLGSHFMKWRRYFDLLETVRWDVVEQENFVNAGRLLFAHTGLPISFHTRIPRYDPATPSVALMGSVLQYLESPLETLRQIRDAGARILIIDRTPFAASDTPQILVQHVPAKIYAASYPLQTLSKSAVSSLLGDKYCLVESYTNGDSPIEKVDARAAFQGSIWKRR